MSARRASAVLALILALSARAEGACTVSATGVNFGTYNVFAASDNTSTGTVTYQCGNADHNIEITISTGSSGTYLPRTLKRGPEALGYNLYLDAAFGSIWGDGGSGTATYHRPQPSEQHEREPDRVRAHPRAAGRCRRQLQRHGDGHGQFLGRRGLTPVGPGGNGDRRCRSRVRWTGGLRS